MGDFQNNNSILESKYGSLEGAISILSKEIDAFDELLEFTSKEPKDSKTMLIELEQLIDNYQ